MKNVLIYHKRQNSLIGGDCYLPLAVAAELQKTCRVTLATNGEFDVAAAADMFGIGIDVAALNVVRMSSGGFLRRAFRSLDPVLAARELKTLVKPADICISTLNIIDFGRPAHHFICILSNIEGKAFQDYARNTQTRTGLRRRARKVGTWFAENVVKPLFGVRPVRKIVADPRERIYPTSRYVDKVLRGYFGDFRGAVFYPPTTFDFPAAGEARDPLKVVCIGRIFPPKRVTEIIAAVSRARELSGKDLTLDIAGDLPPSAYSDSVRDLAARNGWISLKGPLYGEDKRRFLPTGTYAVHAQRDEAFGIAVTEYLKAGVVPIVPDAGGSREVVDNPALAYGSVEDAAQILSRLVCDASFRDEMVRHCRARAETFSRSAYRERQRRLLEEITTR